MARPNGQNGQNRGQNGLSQSNARKEPTETTQQQRQRATGGGMSKSKEDQTIRVGAAFQAQVPKWGNNEDDDDDNGAYETSWEDETEKNNDFKMVDTSGTICLWYPPGERQFQTNHTKDSDDRIEQYISEATDCKYGLHLEQALGILLFHDYNVAKARQELKEYKPAETGIDAWDADDRTMFETAYRIHAKSFLKIQETLPNKKIADLVHYYYKWKKNKNGEHYYYNKWKKSKNGEKNEAAEQRSKTRRDRRNYPQSQCNMFDEDKEVPSPADIAQTLQALKGTPQWHLRHRREEDKKTEREITNGHQAIQKSKQMIACFQDEHALDFDEINTLVDLDELKEDKTTKDWKDAEEIYKFTIGLRHQGTNFEQIAAIIRTKTAQQLKDFYEADLKENKFEFASNLSSGKEQRGREVKGKKGQAKHKPSSLESATPTTM